MRWRGCMRARGWHGCVHALEWPQACVGVAACMWLAWLHAHGWCGCVHALEWLHACASVAACAWLAWLHARGWRGCMHALAWRSDVCDLQCVVASLARTAPSLHAWQTWLHACAWLAWLHACVSMAMRCVQCSMRGGQPCMHSPECACMAGMHVWRSQMLAWHNSACMRRAWRPRCPARPHALHAAGTTLTPITRPNPIHAPAP
eukprot:349929-Chlamydomonas_euryale.AAC.7